MSDDELVGHGEPIKFFTMKDGSKRSFSIRKGAVQSRTLTLMSTRVHFSIVDPTRQGGALVAPDEGTGGDSATFNNYAWKKNVNYEIQAIKRKQEDKKK